jgi:crossover junction endodeoxyribonuclease RuvC
VLARAGLAVAEYEPARVKRALVGNGRADKKQVAMVVTARLGLAAPPRADAADALAIALLHANVAAVQGRFALLAAAAAARRRPPRRA